MTHTETLEKIVGSMKITATVNTYTRTDPQLTLSIKNLERIDGPDEQVITFNGEDSRIVYRFIGSALFRTGDRV